MSIKINDKEYNEDELKALAKAGVLDIASKHTPASTTLGAQAYHGPDQGLAAGTWGIFADPHARPERFSALQRPDDFVQLLPAVRSQYTDSITEILTGQTAGGTTNADDFCGDPPVPGDLKVCQQTVAWGNYYVKTDLAAMILLGQRRSRSDVPAQILNAGPSMSNPYIPDIMFRLNDGDSHLRAELYKVGVDQQRQLALVSMRGQAGVDNNRTGWFSEFAGLDSKITTGITDSITGLACAVVDSVVESWNTGITATDAHGRTIVEAMTDAMFAVKERAAGVGMADTNWVIVMRREAFRRMTEVWACNYSTFRCDATAAGTTTNVLDIEINKLRLEMWNGRYLLIDGVPVPVVFSEGILHESIANRRWKSDIYIVPMSWAGRPLTYMEYFPVDNAESTEFGNFVDADSYDVLNNGMYLAGTEMTALCKEYHFQARMRMILETPFLAARVDDVIYTYLPQTREAIPGTSLYADGGISKRTY